MKRRDGYALALAALLLAAGCHSTPKSPRHVGEDSSYLIVALDRSDSTIVRRETMLTQLDVLAGDADSARATLDLWAYDTAPVRIWGPNLSQGAKPLQEVKAARSFSVCIPHGDSAVTPSADRSFLPAKGIKSER